MLEIIQKFFCGTCELEMIQNTGNVNFYFFLYAHHYVCFMSIIVSHCVNRPALRGEKEKQNTSQPVLVQRLCRNRPQQHGMGLAPWLAERVPFRNN